LEAATPLCAKQATTDLQGTVDLLHVDLRDGAIGPAGS
jgi:hypothetical protein